MAWNSLDQLGDLENKEAKIHSGILEPSWKPPYKTKAQLEKIQQEMSDNFHRYLEEHFSGPCTYDQCIYTICREKKYQATSSSGEKSDTTSS
jgi:hypothetical protein